MRPNAYSIATRCRVAEEYYATPTAVMLCHVQRHIYLVNPKGKGGHNGESLPPKFIPHMIY